MAEASVEEQPSRNSISEPKVVKEVVGELDKNVLLRTCLCFMP
jgi:hypothetical protein